MQQHAAVCYEFAGISWHGELDQMRPIVISAAVGQSEPVPIWRGLTMVIGSGCSLPPKCCRLNSSHVAATSSPSVPHPIIRNLLICAKVMFGRLRFVSICIIAACGLMRLPSAQCRQVVKLSLQTIAFRGLRAEARRASIASGLPAHGRMSGDFRLGASPVAETHNDIRPRRDSGATDSKSALTMQPTI